MAPRPPRAQTARDYCDLIEGGMWAFDALEVVGWRYDTASSNLTMVSRAATDPLEAERFRMGLRVLMEANERYTEAVGEPHPMIQKERASVDPERVREYNRTRRPTRPDRRRTQARAA